jgi:hypothetical protein
MTNHENTTASTDGNQAQDAAKSASHQALIKRQRERQRATLLKRRQRKSGQ